VPACGTGDRELECLDNLECGAGEACIDGECVLPECLKNADCPAGEVCQEYRCRLDVECTQDGDCNLGSICQDNQCMEPGCQSDADCPQGNRCNIQSGDCEPVTKLLEGETCSVDDECDQSAGLLCDSQVECYGCMLVDPEFSPTFTCRYQCDLNAGACPVEDRACKYRHVGMIGLCIPTGD
jgi:Cys-rich repeat protein